ncbi:MAG: AtpZ/AtpI family protein [Gemmatimonadales bacterium]|nr:MAG: AtpZ/AtpI family protein [Gemmatimonadales bacterium]
MVELARFSGHGLTLALSTGLFLLAGWWVDGRLGTLPLFTILGALTGAAAGFYSMLQHLVLAPRERARLDAAGEPEENGSPRETGQRDEAP